MTASNLVVRLRDIAHGMNAAGNQATLREAADEIERLRAALEEAVRYMGAVHPDVYARTHAPLLKPPGAAVETFGCTPEQEKP